MTDKELLELAAKAAGIVLDFDMPKSCKSPWIMNSSMQWNPIYNSGDALDLSIKLKLEIVHNRLDQSTPSVLAWREGIEVVQSAVEAYEEFELEKDRYSATRIAITRAAAEIGRLMP